MEAASAIFWRVSRKELRTEMVEFSCDCREELLVWRVERKGKVLRLLRMSMVGLLLMLLPEEEVLVRAECVRCP